MSAKYSQRHLWATQITKKFEAKIKLELAIGQKSFFVSNQRKVKMRKISMTILNKKASFDLHFQRANLAELAAVGEKQINLSFWQIV